MLSLFSSRSMIGVCNVSGIMVTWGGSEGFVSGFLFVSGSGLQATLLGSKNSSVGIFLVRLFLLDLIVASARVQFSISLKLSLLIFTGLGLVISLWGTTKEMFVSVFGFSTLSRSFSISGSVKESLITVTVVVVIVVAFVAGIMETLWFGWSVVLSETESDFLKIVSK